MSKYIALKRRVAVTGQAGLGWYHGQGYVQRRLTVKVVKWVVCDSSNNQTVAICSGKGHATKIAALLNEEV